jgi:hypothetical protein
MSSPDDKDEEDECEYNNEEEPPACFSAKNPHTLSEPASPVPPVCRKMSTFAARLKAKKEAAEAAKGDDAPSVPVMSAGNARKRKHSVLSTDPESPIDSTIVDFQVYGMVAGSTPADKHGFNSINVFVHTITVPKDAAHLLQLPSGLVAQLGMRKTENPDHVIVRFPHHFTPGLTIIPPSLHVQFKFDPKKDNGFSLNDLTMGRRVTINGAALGYRAATDRPASFNCIASSIEINKAQKAPLVMDAVSTLFEFARDSPYFQLAARYYYASRLGFVDANRFEAMKLDCNALRAFTANVLKTHGDSFLKIGEDKVTKQAKTVPMIPESAKDFMKSVIHKLDLYVEQDYGQHMEARSEGSFLGAVSFGAFDDTGGHDSACYPLLQLGESPTIVNEYLDTSNTGNGIFHDLLCDDDEDHQKTAAKLNAAAQVVVRPTEESTVFDRSNPPKVFNIEVFAANLGAKTSDGKWQFSTPAIKTEDESLASIVGWLFIVSLRAGGMDLKNVLGLADMRLPMVISTLLPYANAVFMTDDCVQTAAAYAEGFEGHSFMQPSLAGQWGPKGWFPAAKHVVDWVNAIKSVGIAVSEEVVEKYAVDAAGETLSSDTIDNFQIFAEVDRDNKPVALRASTLRANGLYCVNGVPGEQFQAKLKILPEGAADYEFYAVFKGCDKLKNHGMANVQDDDGKELGRNILESLPNQDKINENVAFYAVAVKAGEVPNEE